jgi:DNA polymerase III subunit beta
VHVTSQPLLTIGAFARSVGLTPSALRHYDETGLLIPTEVDDSTGYRYYTPHLVQRARLVVALREAGVPIAAMRNVLDGPPDEARRVLTALMEERAADAARAETALREVLADLDTGTATAPGEGVVDGSVLAAAIRQVSVAADADPESPLSGVLVDLEGERLDVVATNRYWMLVRSLPVEEASGAGRVVLPLLSAGRLAAELDHSGSVPLRLSEDALRLGDDSESVASRIRAGYPAHRAITSGLEPPVARAVLSLPELRDAVVGTRRAEVDLELANAAAKVTAPGTEASETVASNCRGTASVRLGCALLARALTACVGPEVVVEVVADDRPVALRSAYQSGFLALLMPIRRDIA